MAEQQERMSLEQFFEWQQRQERNYELVDGVPVLTVKAMTGASVRHDTVTVNAILALGNRLRGGPCRPRTSDQSVITFRGTRRPDISIECGKPDDRSMATDEPRLIIEILSPSTTRYDRFQKLEEYKLLDAVKVILLVDTEAPRVTVWRRGRDGWGNVEIAGLDQTIDVPEIGCALPLAELFDGLRFAAAPGSNDASISASLIGGA
ncbi:Uma2 family endonuclease [Arvimicrobium flavum]|uniref:Uma2 family endonuclease n=1 Tax=Arvimicrobium flavum TaxID=3393320 RepID=UPI00237AEECA|nr:Uma2 family endonuclease [Mesorhizobium shangrilense]